MDDDDDDAARRRRIYLPLTLAQAVQPKFVVLELVGFSSSTTDSGSSGFAAATPPTLDSPVPMTSSAASVPSSNPLLVMLPPPILPIRLSSSHSCSLINPSPSQTPDLDTFVRVTSSDFRDVVQRFTGASPDDPNLLPVTLPTRLIHRNNLLTSMNMHAATARAVADADATTAGCSTPILRSASELGLRKAPLKLHERRKSSMGNLEKLTTAFHADLSPRYNPSPVSPLVSDFEMLCNATTPTNQPNSTLNSSIALNPLNRPTKSVATVVTVDTSARSALETPISLSTTVKSDGDYATEVLRGKRYATLVAIPHDFSTHLHEAPTAEQGASPTLLNLFPASPPLRGPSDNRQK